MITPTDLQHQAIWLLGLDPENPPPVFAEAQKKAVSELLIPGRGLEHEKSFSPRIPPTVLKRWLRR